MTTTAIRNLSRTMQVLNLTRDVAPKRMMCARTVTHRDGTSERKDVRVVVGDSIHLLAGETKRGFSNAVRRCPDVIAAVRERRIELIEVPDEAKAAEPLEQPKAKTETTEQQPSEPATQPAPAPEQQVEVEVVIESDTREAAPAEAPTVSKPGGTGKKNKG